MTLVLAFSLAFAATWAVTPLAIRVALATGFIDRPAGYKGHDAPTPYLGGSAIMVGVLVTAVALGGAGHGRWVLLAGAAVLWMLGTADDRLNLSPLTRVIAEAAVAGALFATGNGWHVSAGIVDLLLTVGWVIAVVNAVNLMDNMDGTSATVAGTSALGAGGLALVGGDSSLAVLCLAVGGACAGFLPRNLARPSRIFMGDGGSMPLGLLVAGVAMAASAHAAVGAGAVVIGVLLLGLALLDTTLVTFSRRVGGRPLLTGARDHLTHRLRTKLGTSRAVAAFLGGTQLLLCGGAIVLGQIGLGAVLSAGILATILAGVTIVRLNRWPWFDRRRGPRLGIEHRRPQKDLLGRPRPQQVPAGETARA
jgi:UDP-GlcNAc:undecaprenyl-phosphate GlcNAc-1-phosphate transferase